MSALANHEVFVDEMRCKEAYQWSGNSTGLALIDHKVRADEMRCKVCQESDNSTRVEFKLRLHTIGEDRKYFANKFDPVAHLKTSVGESNYLSLLLVELIQEDSGVEWVEAKPFMLRIHHTNMVNASEIGERIENAARKMKG